MSTTFVIKSISKNGCHRLITAERFGETKNILYYRLNINPTTKYWKSDTYFGRHCCGKDGRTVSRTRLKILYYDEYEYDSIRLRFSKLFYFLVALEDRFDRHRSDGQFVMKFTTNCRKFIYQNKTMSPYFCGFTLRMAT